MDIVMRTSDRVVVMATGEIIADGAPAEVRSNPDVIAAITNQLDELSFCTRRYTNRAAVDLARKLSEIAPGNLNKSLFCPGGAEAVGMAVKLARVATGRHKTISMWDSFHGATLDAISIGGEAIFRQDMAAAAGYRARSAGRRVSLCVRMLRSRGM